MGIVVYMVVVVYMVCWKRRWYVEKNDISRNAIYEMRCCKCLMKIPTYSWNISLVTQNKDMKGFPSLTGGRIFQRYYLEVFLEHHSHILFRGIWRRKYSTPDLGRLKRFDFQIAESGPLWAPPSQRSSETKPPRWKPTDTQQREPWGVERSCMMHTSSWPIHGKIWEKWWLRSEASPEMASV